jgi:hypothetical protein
MSDTVRRLLTAILLLGVAAHGGGGEANSLLVGEKLGIDKIAQLTAREHSAGIPSTTLRTAGMPALQVII